MSDKLTQNLTEATVVDTANDRVPIYSAASASELRCMKPDNLIPDASTTVKGKVELATDSETIIGTDTVRAVTPSSYRNAFDDTLPVVVNAATSKTTPVDADEIPLVDSEASNVLKKTTFGKIRSDWRDIPATLTYSSADSPTFVVGTSADVSASVGVGMRVKLNQTTDKYFIVTAITASTMTLYGGTDYSVANSAISSPQFSSMKAPIGFPMDPRKWTVEFLDTADRSQASPTAATWYNPGSLSITIPIGCWIVESYFVARAYKTSDTELRIEVALSTSNNSVSDSMMHQVAEERTNTSAGAIRSALYSLPLKYLLLSSKTVYYLIIYVSRTGATDVKFRGDIKTTTIRAVCAYL